MQPKHYKTIIIGAGLSGLVSAYKLLKNGERDVLLLEARDRIGGRILTDNGIDLGATWFQNYHEYLLQLLEELKLETFPQYAKGKGVLVYNTIAKPHYFEQNPDEPSANRIVGGTAALINALTKTVQKHVQLNTEVLEIKLVKTSENERLIISTETETFSADTVIVTLPPKLAQTLKYTPELPKNLEQVMSQTHTWMSNAIKVGLTFKSPFWREKGLSGTLMSQISPISELYDHSSANESEFSLMGFVNEGMRNYSAEERKTAILNYLKTHLGSEIQEYLTYTEKDWSKDNFTNNDSTNVYAHPQYGHPLFESGYLNNRLWFSGTETSPVYGGYLEGAVYSGLKAAEKVLNTGI